MLASLGLALPTGTKPTLLWNSLLLPLIWVLFLVWCQWDAKPYRPALSLIALTLVSGLVVWQMPAPV